jgi:hypothetical protein
MTIIEFDRKVGRQITINKRAEFTFPNQYGQEIIRHNNFPQQYEVIIGNEVFSGGLYLNPRPYYYFEIHKNGHTAFFNLIEGRKAFHVKVNLLDKTVFIK